MGNLILISFATSLLAMEIPATLASSAYTCTTFSYGSATAYTVATGINNKGQVAGYYFETSDHRHAFLRDPEGSMTSLTSPAGDDNFTPVAINNLGQILGDSFIRNPDGTFITIDQPPTPPGHTYYPYQLSGLNDKGEVGGSFARDFDSSGVGTIDIFIREPDGTYKIIDEVATGGTAPVAIAGPLNNSGFMVEQVRYRDGFLLQPGGPKIPLSYPGLSVTSGGSEGNSKTYGLNNNNVTAGIVTHNYIAFLRTPKGHYPSVVCPDAVDSTLFLYGLNDQNTVVGEVYQGGKGVAFIATPTRLVPHIKVSNGSWTFGPQVVGQLGGYGRIYVSNAGPADLHLQSIYIGETGQPTDQTQSFRFTAANCGGLPYPTTMPPGDWCYLDFSFRPQAPGWQTAAIYIPDESRRSPRVIPLGGTGIGSNLQLSNTSWDFGAHHVGDITGNGVIYMYNRGPAVITFRGCIGLSGPDIFDFNLTGSMCGIQIAPYTTYALAFNFTPTAPGERTAAINLNDNSNNGPISIPIMGWVY